MDYSGYGWNVCIKLNILVLYIEHFHYFNDNIEFCGCNLVDSLVKGQVGEEVEGEEERRSRERLPQAKANVGLCWSKYCLDLLKKSSQTIAKDEAKSEGKLWIFNRETTYNPHNLSTTIFADHCLPHSIVKLIGNSHVYQIFRKN